MYKKIGLVLATALMMTSLAGCGSSSEKAADTKAETMSFSADSQTGSEAAEGEQKAPVGDPIELSLDTDRQRVIPIRRRHFTLKI